MEPGHPTDYRIHHYPEVRFGGYTNVDGTLVFYTRVNALLQPSFVVLDVGCGRGEYAEDRVPVRRALRNIRGKCRKVIGLDPDERGRANPFVDEFRLLEGARWPVESGEADLCLCDNVLEHIQDPDAFFSECRRVLRPGGVLCIRTPNAWSYMGLAARWIPNRLHSAVLERVQIARRPQDIFPTLYRCNTVWRLRARLEEHGFDGWVGGYEAEPVYLSFSRFFYWLGVLHQRHAPGFLKSTLFAFASRQGD